MEEHHRIFCEFHEAKPSEISSFHHLKNMWNLSQTLTDFDKSVWEFKIWAKSHRYWEICENLAQILLILSGDFGWRVVLAIKFKWMVSRMLKVKLTTKTKMSFIPTNHKVKLWALSYVWLHTLLGPKDGTRVLTNNLVSGCGDQESHQLTTLHV